LFDARSYTQNGPQTQEHPQGKQTMSHHAANQEVSVGASDSLILVISLTGFAVLASTLYFVLIRPSASADSDRHDGGGDGAGVPTYDQLKQAKVADLNRAQRRARARTIAKEETKELAAAAPVHISKQERQRAQRDIELRERRAEQEERARIQQAQLQQAALAKEQRDARKLQERTAQALADLEKWETFLKSDEPGKKKASMMTVAELIERLERDQTLDVGQVSLEFKLVGDGRIAGVFANQNNLDDGDSNRKRFIYFSDQELRSIANEIEAKQKVSYAELAAYCNGEIQQTSSTRSGP
jgi:ferric iron reductase protein FhuF